MNTAVDSLLPAPGGNDIKVYFVRVDIRLQIVGYIASSQENSSKKLCKEKIMRNGRIRIMNKDKKKI